MWYNITKRFVILTRKEFKMINRNIDDISFTDIEELIKNEVGESKCLEYKSELLIDTHDNRREFLSDISSFANADGGYIIYGLAEDNNTKLPCDICGISITNEDNFILQLENLLRDSISPRILDINFRFLKLDDQKRLFIIYIHPSLLSPHRVIYRGHDKFYTRNSKGKYPMDVNELRQSFLMSETLIQKIESYKLERLSYICDNCYCYLHENLPILVIQCIPLSAFRTRKIYPITQLRQTLDELNVSAFGLTMNRQIVIDGIQIRGKHNINQSAIAFYKTNGIAELATTIFFRSNVVNESIFPQKEINLIYSKSLIEDIIDSVNTIFKVYQKLEIATPIILSTTILNGEGFTIPSGQFWDIWGKIDRNKLFIPDIYIEDFSIKTEKILHPIFDAIWNACGYTKCPAYNDNSDYIGLSTKF